MLASTWAIRHETSTFYDASRDNRPVAVDIAALGEDEADAVDSDGCLRFPCSPL
jgi:hypothetical protein